MWFRKWTVNLSLAVLIAAAAFGFLRIRERLRAEDFARTLSADARDLTEADRVAKLGNWEAAGPMFRRLEVLYRARGDVRNETYCKVSRYRAEMEVSNLEQLSSEIKAILATPLARRDLQLRQRCLETKGNVDVNLDGVAAKPTFEELREVARQRGDWDAVSRAIGELGLVAFLEGNADVAQKNVVKAILDAYWRGDTGAKIRYLSLLGQGFTHNRGPERGLCFLDRAIAIAHGTSGAG